MLALFGLFLHLRVAYFIALVLMGGLVAVTDRTVAREPTAPRSPFRWHFAMAALFLVGVGLALFVPIGPALGLP